MHSDTGSPENSSRYVTGYLAFPSCAVYSPATNHWWQNQSEQQQIASHEDLQLVTHMWKDRIHGHEITRRKRVDLERGEAMKGEIEWVRCGGILRDKTGKRDFKRTDEIRKDLDLQEREKHALERWVSYEYCWNILLSSSTALIFCDIPWPVEQPPSGLQDLTSQAITDFIFATLPVQTVDVARRDRVRRLLLRFHPDKMSAIVSRVVNEEIDAVKEGIRIVFICLKALQDEERLA